MYIILRSAFLKPSFIEIDYTSNFYDIPLEKPINLASFLPVTFLHVPLEVLDTPS